jgi:hypothetical protein
LKLRCEVAIGCRALAPVALSQLIYVTSRVLPSRHCLKRPFIEGVPGKHQLDLEIELPPLIPGIYSADFWVGSHYTSTMDHLQANAFEVTRALLPAGTALLEHGWAAPSRILTADCRLQSNWQPGPNDCRSSFISRSSEMGPSSAASSRLQLSQRVHHDFAIDLC